MGNKTGKWLAAMTLCTLLLASEVRAQHVAVKSNAVFWSVLAPNAGVEVALNRKATMAVSGAWKPWTVRNGENIRFWIAQPEGRYWFCEAFEGHFIGAHILGAQYYLQHNGRIYDGFLAGSGFTYGYDWVLSPRWNLEALIGFGYARLWYKERSDLPCDRCARERSRNYLGPTAVSLSVSYLF
mgnify:FL=1